MRAGDKAERTAFGFSLLELLVVMAVIGLLAAMTVPALSSITRGAAIARAGSAMLEQMLLARQLATSKGRVAEVRFFQIPSGAGSGPAYRAMQVCLLDERGTTNNASSATPLVRLPDGVAIHTGATYSPLLSSQPASTTTLPGVGSCSYKYIRFRPNGSADLPGSNTFVTAVLESDLATTNTPANYACVNIQPVTGHPSLYRP